MTRIHVAIPAFAEDLWLPQTLSSLDRQTHASFKVWICVNQARETIGDNDLTKSNHRTLQWLKDNPSQYERQVLDHCQGESAPTSRVAGVGWARHRLYEAIAAVAPDAIIVSLDADTQIEPDYLEQVEQAFDHYANAVALAAPYFHHVPESSTDARMILWYEIYLRYFQLSLWRIKSPYAFLPLGSAMAFRAAAYRRIGPFKLRKAAEDFYLMQKLRKFGPIIRWIPSRVYPAARLSGRVPFGTGQHMQDRKEPFFYAQSSFDKIATSLELFESLFDDGSVQLPISDFINQRLNGETAIARMRRNMPDRNRFIRACHEYFDALRTLQFLRYDAKTPTEPRRELFDLMQRLGVTAPEMQFTNEGLDQLRNLLFDLESKHQIAFMETWDGGATW